MSCWRPETVPTSTVNWGAGGCSAIVIFRMEDLAVKYNLEDSQEMFKLRWVLCCSVPGGYKGKKVISPEEQMCSAVQCSAVQCSAVQCSAVQCSAVQCSAVQCSAVQCSAVQCITAVDHKDKRVISQKCTPAYRNSRR